MSTRGVRHIHIHTHDARRKPFTKSVSVVSLRPGQRIARNGKILKVLRIEPAKDLFNNEEYHIITTTGEAIPVPVGAHIATFDADGLAVRKHTLHGFHVAVENPKWTLRSGPGWEQIMPADYGYIEDIKGADGDSLDCYIGGAPTSQLVYVVDQNHAGTKRFDEHKVIFGCRSMDEARKLYFDGHSDPDTVFRGIRQFTVPDFRQWTVVGDMSRPVAEYKEGFYGGG